MESELKAGRPASIGEKFALIAIALIITYLLITS
jgi:hypothetical protein